MKISSLGLLLPLWLAACQPGPAPAPPLAEAPAITPEPAAPPPPATPAPEPETTIPAFQCRGNEPFWALDLGPGDVAVLKTPETEIRLSGRVEASPGGAYVFQGVSDDPSGVSVGALLAPAQCFDSMADGPAMPFNVQVSLPDGQVGSGCCKVAAPAAE